MGKTEYDSEINGVPFKTIIRTKENGEIIDIQHKPNRKLFKKDLHISGAHIFGDKPEQDNYDHFEGEEELTESGTEEKPLKFLLRS